VSPSIPPTPLLDVLLDALLDTLALFEELTSIPLEVDTLEEDALIPPAPAVPPDEPDELSGVTCSSGAQAGMIAKRDKTRMLGRMIFLDIAIRYAGRQRTER
jgi:hypothetical protein